MICRFGSAESMGFWPGQGNVIYVTCNVTNGVLPNIFQPFMLSEYQVELFPNPVWSLTVAT